MTEVDLLISAAKRLTKIRQERRKWRRARGGEISTISPTRWAIAPPFNSPEEAVTRGKIQEIGHGAVAEDGCPALDALYEEALPILSKIEARAIVSVWLGSLGWEPK